MAVFNGYVSAETKTLTVSSEAGAEKISSASCASLENEYSLTNQNSLSMLTISW